MSPDQRVDPENLPEDGAGILCEVERVATAAAVSGADVEQPEIGIAGRGERVESDLATVVVAKGLLDPHEDARRAAIIGCRSRRLGRPFDQHRVLRAVVATRDKVGGGYGVARIEVRVEPAETWRARVVEFRMEREALKPTLSASRLDAQAPRLGGEIEIAGHSLSVVADAVE